MRYLSVNKNTVRNREGIAHTITLLQNIMLSFFLLNVQPRVLAYLPMVELVSWPPTRCSKQGLQRTGKVHKQVTHQEEPAQTEWYDSNIKIHGLKPKLSSHNSFIRKKSGKKQKEALSLTTSTVI